MCLSSLGCHSVSNAASGITSDPIFLTGKQKWSEKSPHFLKEKNRKYGWDDKYFKNNLEKIRMCWRKNVWESWELKAALLLPPPSPPLTLPAAAAVDPLTTDIVLFWQILSLILFDFAFCRKKILVYCWVKGGMLLLSRISSTRWSMCEWLVQQVEATELSRKVGSITQYSPALTTEAATLFLIIATQEGHYYCITYIYGVGVESAFWDETVIWSLPSTACSSLCAGLRMYEPTVTACQ